MYKKAIEFQNLHLSGDTFIMANAWNAGSAVMLAEAGFDAIGTTSAGIAYSHALPDYEGALSFDEALLETCRIVQAVKVPVSMDAENGYGDSAESVFNNMKRIAETGVVGASIEDHSENKNSSLYPVDVAEQRIRSAKAAVANLEYPFTLTARAECFLTGHDNPFDEAVNRLNRYRDAGADCLFAPGISSIEMIRELVKEVKGPISVVMGLSGANISLAELKDAGVARISIGGSLARATFGLVRSAAKEMLEKGTFSYANQQIVDDELCRLFQNNSDC
ncbi:isocitrate lyase/PEP mutase family protein [Marinomonas transparens]|uniref:Isocitrate lyase/phosphoenolpyruvate mutase family protein n=1 Tax=Marinomonas transparens TaxID=2795388 RepID=A0A934JV91_9GAMM|nr:isocitrate lyase/phosphoenolpyruvate mutase family protein [Marinomonas transparens]MBJ7537672.1 isocitrate lyase/phosphoenolpyruvate mutase family protein [Marinomonas transparens]